MIRSRALFAALALLAFSGPAVSEEIGYGRLFVNDFLGDGKDRWRTGSVVGSHVFGQSWDGALPHSFGEIVELRVMGQVIAPSNLQSATGGDRPYATALSVGAHTHFQTGPAEMSVGADMVLIGENTGISHLQDFLHDAFGLSGPSDAVLNGQVANQIAPTMVVEAGLPLFTKENFELRPFAELRAGDETLARAGFDLRFGAATHGDLMVRDPVTGLRYRTMPSQADAWAFVVGADVAHVEDSAYLSNAEMEDTRTRVRAGVHLQRSQYRVFYGVSWLSEEFKTQDEAQIVGALRLQIDF